MLPHLFHGQKNQNGKYKKPYYSFRSVRAGKVLDMCQDGPKQGRLIIWSAHGADQQSFAVKRKGEDYYIKCKRDGKYLTVEGAANGAKLFTAPWSGQITQKFRIDEKQPHSKEYVIYTYCGKVLDVIEGSKKNGA